MHEKRLANCHQALGHFDAFYKPVYGREWPSIRVSLLSLPKYCAAVNCYGNLVKAQEQLLDHGTSDFLLNADLSKQDQSIPELLQDNDSHGKEHLSTDVSNPCTVDHQTRMTEEETLTEGQFEHDDLNVFVPTEKVYSERDLLLREEISMNSFEPRDISLEILPVEHIQNFPSELRTFVFPSGVVSQFPSPKSHHGILGRLTL